MMANRLLISVHNRGDNDTEKRTEYDDGGMQKDVEQLEEPRPGLQGVAFPSAEHESDGLDTRRPEIGD